MKKFIFTLGIFFLSFFVFATSAPKGVSNKDFATRLAKELNLEVKGSSFEEIILTFPDNFQAIFKNINEENLVNRKLAVDIFSYFLDEKEIAILQNAGKEDDILSSEEIDSLFLRCIREGKVLTYIVPPSHSFTNRLDPKLNELYQTSGDNGYKN